MTQIASELLFIKKKKKAFNTACIASTQCLDQLNPLKGRKTEMHFWRITSFTQKDIYLQNCTFGTTQGWVPGSEFGLLQSALLPTLFAACLEIHSCKMKNREKRHVNLAWESWRRGERLRRTGWLCIFYTKFSLILISPIQWTKHEPNNQILLKPCASPVIDFRILIKTLMCPSISRW